MHKYLGALAERDFRRLFIGASVSSLGDGMSFVALAWLVINRPHGAAQLGLLAICYTGPVFVGGWLAGVVLDRFDKRQVIAADCVGGRRLSHQYLSRKLWAKAPVGLSSW